MTFITQARLERQSKCKSLHFAYTRLVSGGAKARTGHAARVSRAQETRASRLARLRGLRNIAVGRYDPRKRDASLRAGFTRLHQREVHAPSAPRQAHADAAEEAIYFADGLRERQ